jgi:hypothetical protein
LRKLFAAHQELSTARNKQHHIRYWRGFSYVSYPGPAPPRPAPSPTLHFSFPTIHSSASGSEKVNLSDLMCI